MRDLETSDCAIPINIICLRVYFEFNYVYLLMSCLCDIIILYYIIY